MVAMLNTLRAAVQVTRNAVNSAVGRPDYKRWSSTEGLEQWWDARTEAIAALVPPRSRVIEFGAGRRQLEKLLPADCTYTPSDLIDRGSGTIVCDLNRRPLPDLRHLAPTVAVFGGVVEYTRDLQSLAAWLMSMGIETCIVSFDAVPAGLTSIARTRERLRRWYFGYHCNLTEAQLMQTFEATRMSCAEKRIWTTQGIYRFVRAL
jgi:hypothetical protein